MIQILEYHETILIFYVEYKNIFDHLLMQIKFIILLFCFCLISCKNSKNKTDAIEINFSVDNKEFNSDLFDISFVKLETNKDCLLGGISQCIKTSTGFILLDNMVSKSVYLFSNEGKFIKRIGKQGNGPSEYIHPFSISIDSIQERLSVIDLSSQKILFYHLSDFRFLSERKLPFLRTEMESLSPNCYCWSNFIHSEVSDAHLFITDSTFRVTKHYLPISFSSAYSLGTNRKLRRQNGEITFYLTYKPEVYRLKNDSVQCVYKFNFNGNKMASIDYLNDNAANNQNYIPKLLDSPYVAFYNFHETKYSICVPYYLNKKMFFGFYDKENQKSYCFSQEEIQKGLKVGAFSAPISVINNNSFVSLLRPDLLLQIQEDGQKLDNKLKELLSQSTVDDNPILLIYSLKRK